VDEYETSFKFHPETSAEPLTMGELVELLGSVEGLLEGSKGLTSTYRDFNLQAALELSEPLEKDAVELLDFLTVWSPFYPELKAYYIEEALDWLERVRASRRDKKTGRDS
jgi:hypothetical protein